MTYFGLFGAPGNDFSLMAHAGVSHSEHGLACYSGLVVRPSSEAQQFDSSAKHFRRRRSHKYLATSPRNMNHVTRIIEHALVLIESLKCRTLYSHPETSNNRPLHIPKRAEFFILELRSRNARPNGTHRI